MTRRMTGISVRGRAQAPSQNTQILFEEAQTLEVLNRVGNAVAAELDLDRVVQVVTDAATELSHAAFGAFFYNVIDAAGEAYTLYALSGVPARPSPNFPCHATPRSLRRPSAARESCAPQTSPKIPAMPRTILISACRRGIFRSGAIWRRPWCREPAKCSAVCFLGIPRPASSPSAPSALLRPSRCKPASPSTRPGSTGRPRRKSSGGSASKWRCAKARRPWKLGLPIARPNWRRATHGCSQRRRNGKRRRAGLACSSTALSITQFICWIQPA